ncbi:MAG: phosphoribosylglycinamide formyltransferase [Nitrospirales bacterium]|nr:phosphoribosylglycinamide formyltransferase [Nitrospira sp.]MDR4499850.1 phosphoribosylglycinamide formyltransferase [Nitrospirales bacterium]
MAKVVLGVLISGRGSNLQSIIDAIEAGTLDARIAVVVSNKADAFGLQRAQKHGIKSLFVDPRPFKGQANPREAYDRALLDVLKAHGVELVILAGYMKIVSPVLIDAYEGQMMNIHPSLLPAFPGLHAQKQALDWGTKVSGCTVHVVTEGMDEGPIVLQAAVPIEEDDTEETLAARILEQEHRIYPKAIQLFAEGRVRIEGRRTRISECVNHRA